MPTVNGLPAHVLLVHAVVVLVPLTAAMVIAAAVSTRWRERLGLLPVLAATALVVLTPLTTSAGEWLQKRVPDSAKVRHHAELGDMLLPWVTGLLVIAVTAELCRRDVRWMRWLNNARAHHVVDALAGLIAIGTVLTVVVIGDSGAQAVWHGRFNP